MVALSMVAKRELTRDEKRQRTQARVGLASNVVGLGAGTLAVKEALTDPALRAKVGSIHTPEPRKITGKTKLLASGALGLQLANMGGDVVANRVLARSAGGSEKKVKKADDQRGAVPAGVVTGTGLTLAAGGGAAAVRNARAARREAAKIKEIAAPVKERATAKLALLETAGRVIPANKRKALSDSIRADAMREVESKAGGRIKSALRHKAVASQSAKVAGVGALLAAGGLGAEGALHANRDRVRKDESYTDSYISKAAQGTGKGHLLSDDDYNSEIDSARKHVRPKIVLGHAAVGGVGTGLLSHALTPRHGPLFRGKHRALAIAADTATGAGIGAGLGALQWKRSENKLRHDPIMRRRAETAILTRRLTQDNIAAEAKKRGLAKAYRRFDPEADRQRRLGLYAGLGALGAGVAGQEAARSFTTDVQHAGGKVRGIALKPGKGKKAALLSAAALASGGGGLAAYRRGLHERNDPWN